MIIEKGKYKKVELEMLLISINKIYITLKISFVLITKFIFITKLLINLYPRTSQSC